MHTAADERAGPNKPLDLPGAAFCHSVAFGPCSGPGRSACSFDGLATDCSLLLEKTRHSDYRVIIPFGGGGCRWDLMNEQSARCSQPGSMPSTPAILSACSP